MSSYSDHEISDDDDDGDDDGDDVYYYRICLVSLFVAISILVRLFVLFCSPFCPSSLP